MKMSEMPEELSVKAIYPSGGMEKIPADHDVKQPGALGEAPMGNMGPDGDNPSIDESGVGLFGKGPLSYCEQVRKSSSSDPTPAMPGA